jgi:hypothetical protein
LSPATGLPVCGPDGCPKVLSQSLPKDDLLVFFLLGFLLGLDLLLLLKNRPSLGGHDHLSLHHGVKSIGGRLSQIVQPLRDAIRAARVTSSVVVRAKPDTERPSYEGLRLCRPYCSRTAVILQTNMRGANCWFHQFRTARLHSRLAPLSGSVRTGHLVSLHRSRRWAAGFAERNVVKRARSPCRVTPA